MKKHSDVWVAPFKLDEYGESYVFDANGQMALMFYDDDDDQCTPLDSQSRHKVVDILNGAKNDFPILLEYYQGEIINENGEYVFCIRGWGHLTSTLNLNNAEAARIQDDFGNYIVNKLNGKSV